MAEEFGSQNLGPSTPSDQVQAAMTLQRGEFFLQGLEEDPPFPKEGEIDLQMQGDLGSPKEGERELDVVKEGEDLFDPFDFPEFLNPLNSSDSLDEESARFHENRQGLFDGEEGTSLPSDEPSVPGLGPAFLDDLGSDLDFDLTAQFLH